MVEDRDLAHEADMRRLRQEQLRMDISAEEAAEECPDDDDNYDLEQSYQDEIDAEYEQSVTQQWRLRVCYKGDEFAAVGQWVDLTDLDDVEGDISFYTKHGFVVLVDYRDKP